MRTMLALIVLLLLPAVHAAERFAFDKTPGILPKAVIPRHYELWIKPDLATNTFEGRARIDIHVREPVREIALNAVDLAIAKAVLDSSAGKTPPITLQFSAESGTQTIKAALPAPLAKGPHRLLFEYSGKISGSRSGLYRLAYRDAKGPQVMLGTFFEPADARRMFPCWDEPVFRATVAMTVVLPSSLKAISNMPVRSQRPAGDGLTEYTFATTPPISTYLVALTAGDWAESRVAAGNVQLGIYTPHGKEDRTAYAMEVARGTLAYYEDYFGVPYALPKLDQIARPGGPVSSMENWGAIDYHELHVLLEPVGARLFSRQLVYRLMTHEISHQWFGNLVTMAWWDDRWLNEGFATWIAARITTHTYPEWNEHSRLKGAKERVMVEDALSTTHPIHQPIRSMDEFVTFDNITYWKSYSLIRMLESYLGEGAFRSGIRSYFKEHSGSNTTAADLWHHLEKASGKPVAEIGRQWIMQAGLPLVRVSASCRENATHVLLQQERFTVNDPKAAPQIWSVPVTIARGADEVASIVVLLEGKSRAVELPGCSFPVRVNVDDVGYYRVAYDEETNAALTRVAAKLPLGDRLGLLSDAWALVEAGRAPASRYLALAEALTADPAVEVWQRQVANLVRIDRLQADRPGQSAFRRWAARILRSHFERIGWDAKPDEDPRTGQLRSVLLDTLGRFDDASVIAESKRRFAAYVTNPASLHPELRPPVLVNAGRHADEAQYEQIRAKLEKTLAQSDRVLYLRAIQAVRDPALVRRTLALSTAPEFPAGDVASNLAAVAESGGAHASLAWQTLRENFGAVSSKVPPVFRKTIAPNVAIYFSDAARANELEEFVRREVKGVGAENEAKKAAVEIRAAAALKSRLLPEIDAWVRRATQ